MKNNLIFVHFNTNEVLVYKSINQSMKLIEKQQLFINETLVNEELYRKIDNFLLELQKRIENFDNKHVRLLATGIFQEFSIEEKKQLVIHVYVSSGLYFNIIEPDLEKFYLEKSFETTEKKELITGMIKQEFRKVVICGSFQKNIKEISSLMNKFEKNNIDVLSPWTQELVEESIGTDFILLKGQELFNERDAWRHKFDHMNKFAKADAIIVCNPDGIVGKGTMFEFGFMVAYSKRIIFINEPKDLSILFPYEIGLNF